MSTYFFCAVTTDIEIARDLGWPTKNGFWKRPLVDARYYHQFFVYLEEVRDLLIEYPHLPIYFVLRGGRKYKTVVQERNRVFLTSDHEQEIEEESSSQ